MAQFEKLVSRSLVEGMFVDAVEHKIVTVLKKLENIVLAIVTADHKATDSCYVRALFQRELDSAVTSVNGGLTVRLGHGTEPS